MDDEGQRQGLFDVALVWKLDRFARNRYDSAQYKAQLKNGVKVLSATENISDGPEDIIDDNFVEYITDAVMDLQGRESSALPALRKQLEDTERGVTNMFNAIQAGIINTSTKQRLDELKEAKQRIELQIIQEEMKHPLTTCEDVTYWMSWFRRVRF